MGNKTIYHFCKKLYIQSAVKNNKDKSTNNFEALDMSNPIGKTSFNVSSRHWLCPDTPNHSPVADTGNTPEESLNEGRRDYSLNISRSPYRVSRHDSMVPWHGSIASNTNFCPIENLNNDPLTENAVPKRDPLTVLNPITDGVLVITAIIFIVALGFIAVIVIMALIRLSII